MLFFFCLYLYERNLTGIKNMNLEKLLAENMIRFGTKNLSQFQIKKVLKEALVNIGAIAAPIPLVNDFIQTKTTWGPSFNAAVTTIESAIKKNNITFSVGTDVAAAIIAVQAAWEFRTKDRKIKTTDDVKTIVEEYFTTYSGVGNFGGRSEIQLNESTDAPGKVLSLGVITSAGVSGTEPGQSSNLDDVILFCNSYNLFMVASDITQNGADVEVINILPYRRNNGKIQGGSFVPGFPTQPGGAGSLDITSALDASAGNIIFYSKQTYDAASAASVGRTRTDIIYTPGPEVICELPPTLFATGTIIMNNADAVITTIIANMKKLGTIEKVRIESGASSDRPVEGTSAQFATKVGMPVDKVPVNVAADKNKEFIVTDPMVGGNAFLAYYRGQVMLKALGNLAGVTPAAPEAIVAPGGDAAQFAKIYFTIKKPDNTTTITADDLATIGVGAKTTNLEGQFKIAKFMDLKFN
jgi:hypothetical protein